MENDLNSFDMEKSFYQSLDSSKQPDVDSGDKSSQHTSVLVENTLPLTYTRSKSDIKAAPNQNNSEPFYFSQCSYRSLHKKDKPVKIIHDSAKSFIFDSHLRHFEPDLDSEFNLEFGSVLSLSKFSIIESTTDYISDGIKRANSEVTRFQKKLNKQHKIYKHSTNSIASSSKLQSINTKTRGEFSRKMTNLKSNNIREIDSELSEIENISLLHNVPDKTITENQTLYTDETVIFSKIPSNLNQEYLLISEKCFISQDISKLIFEHFDFPPPNIVLSFPSTDNLTNNFRFRQVMRESIIHIAATTNIWLLTDGMNRGISAFIGNCLKSHVYKKFAKRVQNEKELALGTLNTSYDILPPLLGITRFEDISHNLDKSSMSVSDSLENVPSISSAKLDKNYTNFLIIKDSSTTESGESMKAWTKLEQQLCRGDSVSNDAFPVIRVIIDDSYFVLLKVYDAISSNISCIVMSNYPLIKTIHNFIFSFRRSKSNQFKEEKRNFTLGCRAILESENIEDVSGFVCKIDFILKCYDLVTLFDMNSTYCADLSKAIIFSLLKSSKKTGKEKQLEALSLVMDWNRVDLAEEIFTESSRWTEIDLFHHFFRCLLMSQTQFIDLFLERSVINISTFVWEMLPRLYFSASKYPDPLLMKLREYAGIDLNRLDNPANKIKYKAENIQMYNLENQILPLHFIGNLVEKLMQRSFKCIYCDDSTCYSSIQNNPIDHLFVWAVVCNRWKLAQMLLYYCNFVMSSALFGKCLILGMHTHLRTQQDVSENDLNHLQLKANQFEMVANGILDETYKRDSNLAHRLLLQTNASLDNNNCLEIAVHGRCMTFLANPCVQSLLDIQWKKPLAKNNPLYLRLIAFFIPFLIPRLRFDNNTNINFLSFYNSPSIKFMSNVIFFLLYLLLYSYVVLFEWKKSPNLRPSEWIFILWSFSYFIEESRQLLFSNVDNSISKNVKDYFRDRWNRFDATFIILFLIGVTLRLLPWVPLTVSRHLFAIIGFVLFFRILQFLMILRESGPFVYMVFKMLRNLGNFAIVALIFLLANGIATQTILYQDLSPYLYESYRFILGNILFKPYLQVFGEFSLGEVSNDLSNNTSEAFSTSEAIMYISPQIFVYIFLVFWILMSDVLLLSIIIAKFNNTFLEIESNAAIYWKYKFFNSVREFEDKPILPPPLNILTLTYSPCLLIYHKYFIKRTSNENNSNPNSTDLLYAEFEKKCVNAYRITCEISKEDETIERISGLEERVKNMQQLVVSLKSKVDIISATVISNNSLDKHEMNMPHDDDSASTY